MTLAAAERGERITELPAIVGLGLADSWRSHDERGAGIRQKLKRSPPIPRAVFGEEAREHIDCLGPGGISPFRRERGHWHLAGRLALTFKKLPTKDRSTSVVTDAHTRLSDGSGSTDVASAEAEGTAFTSKASPENKRPIDVQVVLGRGLMNEPLRIAHKTRYLRKPVLGLRRYFPHRRVGSGRSRGRDTIRDLLEAPLRIKGHVVLRGSAKSGIFAVQAHRRGELKEALRDFANRTALRARRCVFRNRDHPQLPTSRFLP